MRRQTTPPRERRSSEIWRSSERLDLAVGAGYAALGELGELDEAFRWFEKSVADRSMCVPWFGQDPRLDPLRNDPRLAALIRCVGLPSSAVRPPTITSSSPPAHDLEVGRAGHAVHVAQQLDLVRGLEYAITKGR